MEALSSVPRQQALETSAFSHLGLQATAGQDTEPCTPGSCGALLLGNADAAVSRVPAALPATAAPETPVHTAPRRYELKPPLISTHSPLTVISGGDTSSGRDGAASALGGGGLGVQGHREPWGTCWAGGGAGMIFMGKMKVWALVWL